MLFAQRGPCQAAAKSPTFANAARLQRTFLNGTGLADALTEADTLDEVTLINKSDDVRL